MKQTFFIVLASAFLTCQVNSPDTYLEVDGLVAVEAEHYLSQSKTGIRKWYVTTETVSSGIQPDQDENHAANASNKTYIEILPDTRCTHDDLLIHGDNFSNIPGKLGIVTYRVYFQNPGKYYIWVRAYSTGTEDNGIHVGIDGKWPETGMRMQWCEGKHQWTWASRQRTEEVHCGEPYKIFLNVNTKGLHTISFSMREDGFEFDKWIMVQEKDFVPEDAGPEEVPKK